MLELGLLLFLAQQAYDAGRRDGRRERDTAPDDRLYSESRATTTWGRR